jgi:hypothetical protein
MDCVEHPNGFSEYQMGNPGAVCDVILSGRDLCGVVPDDQPYECVGINRAHVVVGRSSEFQP